MFDIKKFNSLFPDDVIYHIWKFKNSFIVEAIPKNAGEGRFIGNTFFETNGSSKPKCIPPIKAIDIIDNAVVLYEKKI